MIAPFNDLVTYCRHVPATKLKAHSVFLDLELRMKLLRYAIT